MLCQGLSSFFFSFFKRFIYFIFRLWWVLVAARGLSLVAVSGLLTAVASFAVQRSLLACRLPY